MDRGKVTILIPADVMTLDAIKTVADKLSAALCRSALGDVTSQCELDYEPFTIESRRHGQRWQQINLNLNLATNLHQLSTLLVDVGVPFSSHIIYADKGHMSGELLGTT